MGIELFLLLCCTVLWLRVGYVWREKLYHSPLVFVSALVIAAISVATALVLTYG